MMRRLMAIRGPKPLGGPRMLAAVILAGSILATAGCASTGGSPNVTIGVGVYGTPMYGPGPWRGYPYPGMYPTGGGSV